MSLDLKKTLLVIPKIIFSRYDPLSQDLFSSEILEVRKESKLLDTRIWEFYCRI
jgi:hypothetical protein